MSSCAPVYVLLVGEGGRILARRYVPIERLGSWLRHHAPGACHCEVLSDAPERGGTALSRWRRGAEHEWAPADA